MKEKGPYFICHCDELLEALISLAFHADNSNNSELKIAALKKAYKAIAKAQDETGASERYSLKGES